MLLPISFGPLLSGSIELNCDGHPPGFALQCFLSGLTTAPASSALGVPPSASTLRRGRRVCPGTEAGATRGHAAAPLLHPTCCPQERSVGMLATCWSAFYEQCPVSSTMGQAEIPGEVQEAHCLTGEIITPAFEMHDSVHGVFEVSQ